MVRCMKCREREGELELRYARLVLCSECFTKYYIDRIRKTVEEYKMFEPGERVGISYLADKKSVGLISGLVEAYPDTEFHILYVDLGTSYYTIEGRLPIDQIIEKYNIELHIYSLPSERGYTIEDFRGTKYWRKICSTCGIIKRYYTSYLAKQLGLDVVATPHTLDDVVEILFTLFIDGRFEDIINMKPVKYPEFQNQVRLVKPLIKTYEWEVEKYVDIKGLPYPMTECPLKKGARSTSRKRLLQEFEDREPAFMRKLYRIFMKKLMELIEKEYKPPEIIECRICSGPSLTGICGKCVREVYLKDRKKLDIKIG